MNIPIELLCVILGALFAFLGWMGSLQFRTHAMVIMLKATLDNLQRFCPHCQPPKTDETYE